MIQLQSSTGPKNQIFNLQLFSRNPHVILSVDFPDAYIMLTN